MFKKIIGITLVASLLSGCAGWYTKYQPIGKIGGSQNRVNISPDQIDIYVQEYPKGFIYQDGVVSVVEGSKNRILGEITIGFKPPNTAAFMLVSIITLGIGSFFFTKVPTLTRQKAIEMLQTKASEMGANAVIGAKLPTEDKRDKYSIPSGMAVIIAQ